MEVIFHEDPCCSWCWAFQPVETSLLFEYGEHIRIRRVLGGPSRRARAPRRLRRRAVAPRAGSFRNAVRRFGVGASRPLEHVPRVSSGQGSSSDSAGSRRSLLAAPSRGVLSRSDPRSTISTRSSVSLRSAASSSRRCESTTSAVGHRGRSRAIDSRRLSEASVSPRCW